MCVYIYVCICMYVCMYVHLCLLGRVVFDFFSLDFNGGNFFFVLRCAHHENQIEKNIKKIFREGGFKVKVNFLEIFVFSSYKSHTRFWDL